MGSLLSIAPAALRSASPVAYGGSVSAVRAVSVERNRSFDLAIKTAEGDIATIRIGQQESASASTQVNISERGRALFMRANAEYSSVLDASVSVQGSLNAEETASINALVEQVNGVAEDFFAGDMKQAIRGAAGISFADDSLSAFAFDLQSQEVRRAVAVYENVAATTAPAGGAAAPASAVPTVPAARERSGWLQSLRALFDAVTASTTDPRLATGAPTRT